MNQVNKPLSNNEINELDDFLLSRGLDEEDEAYDETIDEGIINISELDGFLTAVVSGPELMMPSQWMPEIWGDKEPEWESTQAFEHILSLMMRHMNAIVGSLMNPGSTFTPLLLESQIEDKSVLITDDWCEGYIRGVGMAPESWLLAEEEVGAWLGAIALFTNQTDLDLYKKFTDEEISQLQQKIPAAAQAIHSYWLEQRDELSVQQPFVNEEPKVGRNDPCPCGSGKKFKKCCLH